MTKCRVLRLDELQVDTTRRVDPEDFPSCGARSADLEHRDTPLRWALCGARSSSTVGGADQRRDAAVCGGHLGRNQSHDRRSAPRHRFAHPRRRHRLVGKPGRPGVRQAVAWHGRLRPRGFACRTDERGRRADPRRGDQPSSGSVTAASPRCLSRHPIAATTSSIASGRMWPATFARNLRSS